MSETHLCTQCGETKPRSDFHRRSSRPLGIQQPCKPCSLQRRRDWYARNPQLALGINRAWRERNPDVYRRGHRAAELRRRYKLTPQRYELMLAAQGGLCAICGHTPDDRRLAVDHDHACCPDKKTCGGCIRGLLCGPCNRHLGWLDQKLPAVLSYLASHRRSPH